MSEASESNPVLSYYRRYIGDPERTVDVYVGFGLFFAGVALGAVGIGVFLYSASLPESELSTYAIREVAAVAGAVGLPTLLIGVVVLLPVDKRMLYLSLVGSAVCLVAIALFVSAYPTQWNVSASPDYSARGVAIYSIGLVLVVAATGTALVGHRVEQATGVVVDAEDGEHDEESISDEAVRADIDRELEDAELSWGGVERKESRRLELDTSTVDDVDRTHLTNSATETRTTTSTVNNAVSQLQGLQGGNAETASGESTDDQAAALRELREQQQQQQSEPESLLDRLRNRLQGWF